MAAGGSIAFIIICGSSMMPTLLRASSLAISRRVAVHRRALGGSFSLAGHSLHQPHGGLLRPDIVHLNFSNGGSILRKYVLLRIAKLFGAETVMHFHGQFTAEDVAGRSPLNYLLFPLCRHASRIIVLGKFY